jgi:hypothetical protein
MGARAKEVGRGERLSEEWIKTKKVDGKGERREEQKRKCN